MNAAVMVMGMRYCHTVLLQMVYILGPQLAKRFFCLGPIFRFAAWIDSFDSDNHKTKR